MDLCSHMRRVIEAVRLLKIYTLPEVIRACEILLKNGIIPLSSKNIAKTNKVWRR